MQPIPREDIAALLRWYVDQGFDETIGEEPVDRVALPPPAPIAIVAQPAIPAPALAAPPAAPATGPRPAPPPIPPRAPVPIESPQLVEGARALAQRCGSVAELEAAIRGFEGCALKRTAKNTVFADGVAGEIGRAHV